MYQVKIDRMEKIKIKEPCHEKWAEFTPTQQGAFCTKCSVDVIDFSTKSNDEIKSILVSNSGNKMCGRFSKKQLNTYNSEYHIWQNQNTNTFQSKFVLSLVLAFGLTLFSCSNATHDSSTMGEIEVFNEVDTLKTKIDTLTTVYSDTVLTITPLETVPKVKKTVHVTTEDTIRENCVPIKPNIDDLIMGDVESIEEEEELHTKGKVSIDNTNAIKEIMTLGMIAPPKVKPKNTKVDTSAKF